MRPQARTDIQNLLKNSDDVELPMDPAYYQRLHDKIMMKIDDKQEVPGTLPLSPRKPNLVAVKAQSIRR